MTGGEIFVPKLPSVTIADLAAAVDPDWPTEVIGRRPGGEKFGEVLIGPEEVSRTVMQNGAYVVLPGRRNWSTIPYHGERVKPDFTYASHTNSWWLTPDQLRELLKA
jgi:UDP-N-acetylglucosamine 4,6-dehydratase